MIYIIIPVFNRWFYTQACLISLENQSYLNFKIIVVDHGSSDNTSEEIALNFPNVTVLKGESSMWWTAATNLGVKYAIANGATFVLTLNNDLVVEQDYLYQLINLIEIYPKSIIGSASVDIKNKEQISYAGTKWIVWQAKYISALDLKMPYSLARAQYEAIQTDLLPGRGTLIPVEIFNKIGLYNEFKFPHYMADEDFSLRAKNHGYSLLINIRAVVYSHIESTGLNNLYKNKLGILYLRDTFTSIRSPNKISIRWNFAKNTKIPFAYFLLDFSRVLISQLFKIVKNNK